MFDLANRARPVLKWVGGKSGLLPQLVQRFPKRFDRFIEPFAGGAAMFLALEPGTRAVINDSNPELFNLYRMVRDEPEGLMDALDLFREHYGEEFYYRLRAERPLDPIGQAARTVFLNKTGFNGLYRLNKKGEFNVPFGKRSRCPGLYDRDNLLSVSRRLKRGKVTCLDFSDVLKKSRAGDLVYCDPPYIPISRTASFHAYQAGGFNLAEQARLAESCRRAVENGAIVAVSNSHSILFRRLYPGFRFFTVTARRAVNSNATRRGPIKEWLAFHHQDLMR